MIQRTDRRSAVLVGRVLFLLALAIAGIGGLATGMAPVATTATSAGPERAGHHRARLTSQPVSALANSTQHRAREQSRADVVEPGASTRTPPASCIGTSGTSIACRLPSSVALRVPGRGPPIRPVVS